MGNEASSLGDKTNEGSFPKAFAAAHRAGGPGHTFEY